MSNQQSTRKRLQSIDSMRGIAALIVVYCHILPATSPGDEGFLMEALHTLRTAIFQNGQLGVALFFIISGYVVPFSLLGAKEGGIGKFVISRFMRLYPAYWLSMIAGIWLVGNDIDNTTILANVTMAQRFLGYQDILGVYWTLSVELVFYTLVAGVFVAGIIHNPRRMGWLAFSIVALTLALALARRLFDAPVPAGSMIFISLMFGGAWLRLGVYKSRDLWWIVAAFLLALLAICWLLYYPDKYGSPWLLQFSRYLYATTLFFALLHWSAIKVAFLAYLGRISYSIYLFHIPFSALVSTVLAVAGLTSDGWLMFWLSLLVTISVSALTFKYVELPFVRMGKGLQTSYMSGLARRAGR